MANFEYDYNLSDYIVINKMGVYRNNLPLTEYCGMNFDNDNIRDIMGLFLNNISLRFTKVAELHAMISAAQQWTGYIAFPNPDFLSKMDSSSNSNYNDYEPCNVCYRIKDTNGNIGYWVSPLGGTISYQKKDNTYYKTKKGFKKTDFVERIKTFIKKFPGDQICERSLFLLSEPQEKTK